MEQERLLQQFERNKERYEQAQIRNNKPGWRTGFAGPALSVTYALAGIISGASQRPISGR